VLGWEPDLGTRIGVMPRSGGNADVQWFETDPCYVFHAVNGHTEGRRIVCEVAQYPRLPLPLPGEDRGAPVNASLVRWTLDLDAGTVKLPHRVPAGFHGNWRPAGWLAHAHG